VGEGLGATAPEPIKKRVFHSYLGQKIADSGILPPPPTKKLNTALDNFQFPPLYNIMTWLDHFLDSCGQTAAGKGIAGGGALGAQFTKKAGQGCFLFLTIQSCGMYPVSQKHYKTRHISFIIQFI
jgi:hypothetical protein